MSFGLLLPMGLVALAALLLPLLLHLSRGTEQRPTVFAALRWLQVDERPRRRIRLDELLLLLLRLLLLAALAVLLAQPVLYGTRGGQAWVAVDPSIDREAARGAVAASDAEWHWLAPGYPALDDDAPAGLQPSSSLLRELDARLPADARLTVVVPAEIAGLDGERPVLRRAVDWQVLDARDEPAPAARPQSVTLAVRFQQADDPALPYLRAVAAAWSTAAARSDPQRIQVDFAPASEALSPNTQWLIWLAPGELPATIRHWIETGGVALLGRSSGMPDTDHGAVLWRDANGDVLARGHRSGDGRLMQFQRELVPASLPALLEPSFPDRLRTLFAPTPAPVRAVAASQAPLRGGPALEPMPRPLQPWLALLVGALFLAERWLATSPRRDGTP